MLLTQVLNVSQNGTEKDISLIWKIMRMRSNYVCVCVCVCVSVCVCKEELTLIGYFISTESLEKYCYDWYPSS